MAPVRRILVLNAGSSSLKASVLVDGNTDPVARAAVERGRDEDADASVRAALDQLARQGAPAAAIDAVGHRVVHGGTRFSSAVRIDDDVTRAIEDLASIAPLHNPVALRTIAAARTALPDAPQVATFDTAFHATLEPEAYTYALPRSWRDDWGYRRFGFHGLSVEWATERAAALLGRPVTELGLVVAHLGAGCSVTAVQSGRSVGTSMGLTPLEGLVMATRAGSIDPGILVAAQRQHGLDAETIETILERRSGLLGLSGTSGDVRELLATAARDEHASLALAVFVRAAAAGIAAAAPALRSLDAIVLTGGIGEHAGSIRARIVARLGPLGVGPIDEAQVTEDALLARSPVAILRIEAREDVIVARQVRRVLGAES